MRTKFNNMLRKFQNSGTIGTQQTPDVISPNAIAFTSGFETNRGYGNNGYTSTSEQRNMGVDYDYLLNGLPEPLQIILLDAAHNQSNLPGTILLALSKSSPNLIEELSKDRVGSTPEGQQLLSMLGDNPMSNVIKFGRSQGNTPAYDKNANISNQMELLRERLLDVYNTDPNKFIDNFTKSRIERTSSFGSKNDKLGSGTTKLQEWVERSVAAADYAKDLNSGNANSPDYYYDQNLNNGEFLAKSKPLVDIASQDFPGEQRALETGYYNNVGSAYDNINQQVGPTNPINPVNQTVASSPINTNTMNPIYFDGTYYYGMFKNDDGTVTKQQVDHNGNPKQGGITKQLDKQSAEKEISELYEVMPEGSQEGPQGEGVPMLPNQSSRPDDVSKTNMPDFMKSILNIGKDIGNKISKSTEDKNPYRDQYQDEKDAIKEGKNMLKDFRQQNRAEIREDRLRGQDQNINKRLNKQADRNIFLQARKEEKDTTRKNKRLASEINNMDKLENRITKLKKRHQNKRDNIGVDQFKSGGFYSNPLKRDSFITAADKSGMTTQKFAEQIMSTKAGFKKQVGGSVKPWQDDIEGFGTNFFQGVEGPKRKNLVGSYYDNDKLKDPFGRNVTRGVQKTQTTPLLNNQQASKPTNNDFKYDPKRLTSHGNRLQENALNRVTGANIARFISDPGRDNPLITSNYKPVRQVSTADFNPVYEQEAVARRNISQNTRGTAGQLGNILQLNANLVRSKSEIARKNQLDQRGFDQAYQQQLAAKAAELANARRTREGEDKADYAAREQFLTDTIEQSGAGDIERGKLYNQELRDFNTLQTYVNQLSPEYKVIMKKDGTKEVVFKSTGRPVPQAEFDKKAAQNKTAKRKGGFMNNSKPKKKMRNRLY